MKCLEISQFYDNETNPLVPVCTATCPSYLIANATTGNCDNCKTMFTPAKFSSSGTCVTSCPAYSIIDLASRNGCKTCLSYSAPLKFFDAESSSPGTCVTSCPQYLVANTTTGACDNCKTMIVGSPKFSLNGACVASCPNYSIIDNVNRNGCKSCLNFVPIQYFDAESTTPGACATTCPQYLVSNSVTGSCDNCKTINSLSPKFFYNNACLSACPQYSIIDNTNRNGCKKCLEFTSPKMFYDSETNPIIPTCQTKCPEYLIPNLVTGNCDNCKTLSLGFSYSEACVAGTSCPIYSEIINTNRNGYQSCLSQGKFYDGESTTTGKCVVKCPDFLIPNNANGNCYNCKTLNLGFSYNGACVTGINVRTMQY